MKSVLLFYKLLFHFQDKESAGCDKRFEELETKINAVLRNHLKRVDQRLKKFEEKNKDLDV